MDDTNENGSRRGTIPSGAAGGCQQAGESADAKNDAASSDARKPTFSDACAPLVAAGLTLVPLDGKKPLHSKWTERAYDAAKVIAAAEETGQNVGVRISGTDLLVIDVDPRNYLDGVDSFEKLKADFDIDLDAYPVVRTGSGGLHVYTRRPAGLEAAGKLDGYPGIDFKSAGQVVAPGSLHPDTGRPYVAERMQLLALEALAPSGLLEALGRKKGAASDGAARLGEIGPQQLKANLDQVSVDSVTTYDEWVQLMMACHAATAGEGLDEFTEWSTGFSGDAATPEVIAEKWNGFSHDGSGVTSALLYRHVRDAGGTIIDRRTAEEDFEPIDDYVPSSDGGRWHFITLEELEAMPPPRWLIDGLIQEETLVAIYGAPESGKSFLAIDMVMSVATARPWHGRHVMQGAVLYIAAEGARGLGKRVNAWKVHHSVAQVPFHLMCEDLNLTNEKDAVAFCREMVEALGPLRMIVIDTLNQTATGADENSAQDMGRYVKAMKRMRDATGATVAVVHHSGKDTAKGMRGSTALLGGFDTTIEVVRPNEDGTVINVRVKKQKDGERESPIHFEMTKVADSLVLQVTKQGITETDKQFLASESLSNWIAAWMDDRSSAPFKDLVNARKEHLSKSSESTVREELRKHLGDGFENAKTCSDGTLLWLEREAGNSRGALIVHAVRGDAS